jgi:membrane protease YdiL (CAAX protease family)
MKSKKSIVVFLVITFFLSSICYYIRIAGGDKAAGMTSILMWCPGIAAIIVRFIFYRKEKVLGWNGCQMKYIWAAIGIPMVYLFLSYGIYWLLIRTSFTGKIYTNSIVTLLLLVPSSIITATGEEIGWRGFLLPKMTEVLSLKVTILLCGLIWAVWHFPLMLAGLYESGTSTWYQLTMFAVQTVAMTAILAYVRLKSKSVWPAILLHASHNYIDQVICGPLTNHSNQAYFVGETGFVTAIAIILIAILLLKNSRLDEKSSLPA